MALLCRQDFLAQLRADDIPDCAICLESILSATTVECGHTFCMHCIAAWLESKPTCPCCRRTLYQTQGTARQIVAQAEIPSTDFRVTRRPLIEEEVFHLHPYANVSFRSVEVLPHLNHLIVYHHRPPNGAALTYVNGLLDNRPQIIATWLWAKPRSRPRFAHGSNITELVTLAEVELIDNCIVQWEQIFFSVQNTLNGFKDQFLIGSDLKKALIDNARQRIGGVWPNYGEALTNGVHPRRLTTDVKDFVNAIVATAQDAYREKYEPSLFRAPPHRYRQARTPAQQQEAADSRARTSQMTAEQFWRALNFERLHM